QQTKIAESTTTFDKRIVEPGCPGGQIDLRFDLIVVCDFFTAICMVVDSHNGTWAGQCCDLFNEVTRSRTSLQNQIHGEDCLRECRVGCGEHFAVHDSSARMVFLICVVRAARSGMLAVMRNLSWPLSLMWRFFWINSMIRMASIGGLGSNCGVADSPCASILMMPTGLASTRKRCVSISAWAASGSLPKRSIISSCSSLTASCVPQFARRL